MSRSSTCLELLFTTHISWTSPSAMYTDSFSPRLTPAQSESYITEYTLKIIAGIQKIYTSINSLLSLSKIIIVMLISTSS